MWRFITKTAHLLPRARNWNITLRRNQSGRLYLNNLGGHSNENPASKSLTALLKQRDSSLQALFRQFYFSALPVERNIYETTPA